MPLQAAGSYIEPHLHIKLNKAGTAGCCLLEGSEGVLPIPQTALP